MGKEKMLKRVSKIAVNVLIGLFLAVCIFSVIVTLVSNKNGDGAAEIFGYQMRIVTSNSMAACEETDVSGFSVGSIPVNSMVFVQTVPEDENAAKEWYSALKVGDVLTFRYVYTSQVTITHRIVSIEENSTGGYMIRLMGDNKAEDSNLLIQTINTSAKDSPNYVIGKVTGQAYLLGLLISFLQTPLGLVLAIIIPCFIIMMLEIFRIVGIVNKDREKKARAEQKEKDLEIEALRKKVAELEKQSNENGEAEK